MNWTLIKEEGPRFENLVACHLLKWVHFQEDCFGRELELRYFRDVDLREVDFVITENGLPLFLIEAKTEGDSLTKGLHYLKNKFPHAKAYQVSLRGTKDYMSGEGIRVCPAIEFLKTLV